MKPPRQRARILEFCIGERIAGRPFPTPAEISAHLGWKSPRSAVDALNALCFYDKAIGCVLVDGKRRFHLLEENNGVKSS